MVPRVIDVYTIGGISRSNIWASFTDVYIRCPCSPASKAVMWSAISESALDLVPCPAQYFWFLSTQPVNLILNRQP